MSNRKRSKQEKTIKRFGQMAEQYQDQINRQKGIIDRMQKALAVAHGGLHDIQNQCRDIRAARKLAGETATMINNVLMPEEETA